VPPIARQYLERVEERVSKNRIRSRCRVAGLGLAPRKVAEPYVILTSTVKFSDRRDWRPTVIVALEPRVGVTLRTMQRCDARGARSGRTGGERTNDPKPMANRATWITFLTTAIWLSDKHWSLFFRSRLRREADVQAEMSARSVLTLCVRGHIDRLLSGHLQKS